MKGIDDDNEPLQPSELIPLAERTQIMPEIDRWVVRNTLEKIASYQLRENRAKTVFSINLSGRSLCDDGFLDEVFAELSQGRRYSAGSLAYGRDLRPARQSPIIPPLRTIQPSFGSARHLSALGECTRWQRYGPTPWATRMIFDRIYRRPSATAAGAKFAGAWI